MIFCFIIFFVAKNSRFIFADGNYRLHTQFYIVSIQLLINNLIDK